MEIMQMLASHWDANSQMVMCPTPDGNIPCEYLPNYIQVVILQAINSLFF